MLPDARQSRPNDPDTRALVGEALVSLVAERGYLDTSLEMVRLRAGVDGRQAARHFVDLEACFLSVMDRVAHEFETAVLAAHAAETRWPDAIRAAAHRAARFAREHPRETRLVVLESLWAGPAAGRRRDDLIRRFASILDAGRPEAAEPQQVSALASELAVGGVAALLTEDLRKRSRRSAESYVDELTFLVLRPDLAGDGATAESSAAPSAAG